MQTCPSNPGITSKTSQDTKIKCHIPNEGDCKIGQNDVTISWKEKDPFCNGANSCWVFLFWIHPFVSKFSWGTRKKYSKLASSCAKNSVFFFQTFHPVLWNGNLRKREEGRSQSLFLSFCIILDSPLKSFLCSLFWKPKQCSAVRQWSIGCWISGYRVQSWTKCDIIQLKMAFSKTWANYSMPFAEFAGIRKRSRNWPKAPWTSKFIRLWAHGGVEWCSGLISVWSDSIPLSPVGRLPLLSTQWELLPNT